MNANAFLDTHFIKILSLRMSLVEAKRLEKGLLEYFYEFLGFFLNTSAKNVMM